VVIGVDGGGTWTRVAIADADGEEVVRHRGPAGLADPADPTASTERLVRVIREATEAAGVALPVAGLYAGLAGVGDAGVRAIVRRRLATAGLANRIEVVTDASIALDAALGDGAGILLVAGTGSIAHGRAEDGRTGRCGGWGLVVGDEGSGYAMALAGLRGALRAEDGRGAETRLLPEMLAALGLERAGRIPAWAGRADKADVAALAPRVIALAEARDAVAEDIVAGAARSLARHVEALVERLGPWSCPVPLAFHGSVLARPTFARRVEARLRDGPAELALRPTTVDPVTAALHRARQL
jgi:glucosamine kinase